MSSLPEEIIEENILTRLPVKSIARFRCVSRNWNLLFRNPNFIRNHLNHAILMNKFNILVSKFGSREEDYLYSVENDVLSSPFRGHALKIDSPYMSKERLPAILGSCNGLVCIISLLSRSISIWNPATREYTTVPHTRITYPSYDIESSYWMYGFGFDCRNDDYKLLRIVGFKARTMIASEVSEARIYSLASNSWKELGSVPYGFSETNNNGVHLNGVLYWLADVRRSGVKSSVTVGFDISEETFHDFPSPNNKSNEDVNSFMLELGIWKGKLCLFHWNHMEEFSMCTHQNDHIDVWTMMDNKWRKHLKINTAHVKDMFYGCPIQTLQSGEILVKGVLPRRDGIALLSYDHDLQRVRALNINGFPDNYDHVETYIETLVALKSGTYVGE